MDADLAAENRALRARIAELERAATGLDPWLRALLEHAPAFVNVVSPEGRFIATGRTSEGFGSVLGRSVFEFTDPVSHEVMRAAHARACATGQAVTYESIGYGEDGTPGHVYHVRAIPLGEPGAVNALVLVPTDITDRVKLERAIVESEQALRLAISATQMGLWRWDVEDNTIDWDRRMLEIFGLTETPRSFEAYLELVHPDDRGRVEQAVRQALETGHYPTFEHRLRPGADGQVRYLIAVGRVIKDAAGKAVRLMGGALDITEQKRLEAQVARATRVEAVGQLAAGIAHNFNNLLTIVIPNIEMAMLDGRAGHPELATALEAALQARDVVKSLLALARNRSDDGATCDPKQVVSRALAICRATFPREIELSCAIDDSAGAVKMPAAELEQTLLNLLFNARDAVESKEPRAGGARREVRVLVDRTADGEQSWMRLRVTDNGVGMTPEVRARLFEPFFTTKPPHRGSGLGLANVLLRVQQASGRLDCTSVAGEGTTIQILLPEVAAATPVDARPVANATSRGETILLVDDEPLLRNTVRRLLELEGYVVLEASSAAEARKVLAGSEGHSVKLVILDQSMPAQSGLDALPSLRELSTAPIILFSGMIHEQPAGVAAVFEKPARPAELWRLVREVLDREAAASARAHERH